MIIRGNNGTSRLVIRKVRGDKLESPITVDFNEGNARVKPGVGDLLADLFDSITIIDREEDQSEED